MSGTKQLGKANEQDTVFPLVSAEIFHPKSGGFVLYLANFVDGKKASGSFMMNSTGNLIADLYGNFSIVNYRASDQTQIHFEIDKRNNLTLIPKEFELSKLDMDKKRRIVMCILPVIERVAAIEGWTFTRPEWIDEMVRIVEAIPLARVVKATPREWAVSAQENGAKLE
jgi:hypothetical protein